jgi:hypothetical protein
VRTRKAPDEAKDRRVPLSYMTPGEYAIITRDWRDICHGDQKLCDVRKDPDEWGIWPSGRSRSK